MKQKYYRYYQRIGANIGRYRRERGQTQEELAEKTGLSVAFISHLEASGSLKAPSLDTLIAIAEALEVPLHRLTEIED